MVRRPWPYIVRHDRWRTHGARCTCPVHAGRMSGWDALAVAAAGLACGLINSIAGGGSLILFPVLLLTGLAPLDANVTNSVATWPGYVGGVGGFRSEIRERRARLPRLLLVTIAGSVTGCVLLLATPSSVRRDRPVARARSHGAHRLAAGRPTPAARGDLSRRHRRHRSIGRGLSRHDLRRLLRRRTRRHRPRDPRADDPRHAPAPERDQIGDLPWWTRPSA